MNEIILLIHNVYDYDEEGVLMNLNTKYVLFPNFIRNPGLHSKKVIWDYMKSYCYCCKTIKI